MAGLFAKMGPPTGMTEPGDDTDDYSDDALPEDADADMPDLDAGPFDAYADTVLDNDASPEDRKAALREAIMSLIEEHSTGGEPPL